MAEEEGDQAYTLTAEDGTVHKSSHGYTGKGNAVYSNGEIFEGDYVNGVRYIENKIPSLF